MTPNPPTVYIFPHAGGSANFYVPFAKAFSPETKRIALQYPGTQSGLGQTAIPTIASLADNAHRLLTSAHGDGPIAFFGHSMGALVAFEVARRFESAGRPIAALFVSASGAPSRMREAYFRDLSDDELVEFLVELSGTDPKVLDNKEFVDMLLPSLRGYYSAIAGYTCAPAATVSCPIYAFTGTDDDLAPYDNVSGWSEHTTSEFALRVFPGGHFYLFDHLVDVVGDVETRFREAQALERGQRGLRL
jgi:surfactin synthase thioesterase subunit